MNGKNKLNGISLVFASWNLIYLMFLLTFDGLLPSIDTCYKFIVEVRKEAESSQGEADLVVENGERIKVE